MKDIKKSLSIIDALNKVAATPKSKPKALTESVDIKEKARQALARKKNQGVAENSVVDSDEEDEVEDESGGWQFNRDEIGSLYAIGETDAYNKEAPDPRYGKNERNMISVSDDASVEEYMAGYEDAEFNF